MEKAVLWALEIFQLAPTSAHKSVILMKEPRQPWQGRISSIYHILTHVISCISLVAARLQDLLWYPAQWLHCLHISSSLRQAPFSSKHFQAVLQKCSNHFSLFSFLFILIKRRKPFLYDHFYMQNGQSVYLWDSAAMPLLQRSCKV